MVFDRNSFSIYIGLALQITSFTFFLLLSTTVICIRSKLTGIPSLFYAFAALTVYISYLHREISDFIIYIPPELYLLLLYGGWFFLIAMLIIIVSKNCTKDIQDR